MKKDFCTMYLVRHGETEWNRKKLIQGHLDSPLTEQGRQNAQRLSDFFSGVQFDALYASDLLRSIETARILRGVRNLDIKTEKDLRDNYYGHFEGRPREELDTLVKSGFKRESQRDWNFKPSDDIESKEEIAVRFIRALRRISLSNLGKTVLVSTHGGCLRAFLMKIGYAPYLSLPPYSFSNNGYVIVRSDGEDFELEKVEGVTTYSANTVWG